MSTKKFPCRRSYALSEANDGFLRREAARLQRSVNSLINRMIEAARKKGSLKW